MADVGATMAALLQHRPGVDGLSLEERPAPVAGPGEVLIRLHACGIGGTVLNKVRGASPENLPVVPGHEGVGEVVARGAAVERPREGERVMLYYYLPCGRCRRCLLGQDSTCEADPVAKLGEHRDGALAELVAVPSGSCIPIPRGVGFREATVLPDAVGTPVHICLRAGVGPGERMVVIGAAGGVGVHLVQVARAFGAEVVGVDVGDRAGSLGELGASACLDAGDPGWTADVERWGTVVVDFVGTRESFRDALEVCGRGARLMVMAPHHEPEFGFPPWTLIGEELSIMGSKYTNRSEVALGAQLLADGTIRSVIGREVSLEETVGALRDIGEGRAVGRTAVLMGAIAEGA